MFNQLKEDKSYNQSQYYGFYHHLIPCPHNGSSIKLTKPVAYPFKETGSYMT